MKQTKFNPSVVIAFIAVMISLMSTFLSLRETEILKDQQLLMSSQKEASVWPFMENDYGIFKSNDSVYLIYFYSKNKGIGPAIIDSVEYRFKNTTLRNWEYHRKLQEFYPMLKIGNSGNAELSNRVLSMNERLDILTISLTNTTGLGDTEFNSLVNEIAYNISMEYCYCSVYGNCWKVQGRLIRSSKKCTVNHTIR